MPRDVARKIFLRVLYLVEFPRHLFVFAKAVVIPGLLCLGAALLGVIESVLCALGLRVPQVCLPDKKGTLVCAFARHSSLLPPPRVAGLALGTPSGIKQLIRLVPIARRHQLTRGPRQEALRPCRDNGLRESPDAQGADECPTAMFMYLSSTGRILVLLWKFFSHVFIIKTQTVLPELEKQFPAFIAKHINPAFVKNYELYLQPLGGVRLTQQI